MKPIVLIHGYSAESRTADKKAVRKIYHSLPDDLREEFGGRNVVEVDLSRWISLEDGVTLDDIALALDQALTSPAFRHLRKKGFSVIIHSTGALIVRKWVRGYTTPEACPLERIMYLAGANFGSGWAHLGKAQLSKWGRGVFAGAEVGEQVLNALELGASQTLDLHLHFTRDGQRMAADYGVQEFCIIGSQAAEQWYRRPMRYAREDGADGVVRVSSCNLNFNYVRIEATPEGKAIGWKELQAENKRDLSESHRTKCRQYYYFAQTWQATDDQATRIPFAIPYDCAHSGDKTGVVGGEKNREQVKRLIRTAFGNRSWPNKIKAFEAEMAETYRLAAKRSVRPRWRQWVTEPASQYDPHAQVILRVFDQFGNDVKDMDVYFDSGPDDAEDGLSIRDLIEDKHVNQITPNVICFYLRTEGHNKDRAQRGEPYPWDGRVPRVPGCYLEVSAQEAETQDIQYLPLRIQFDHDMLTQWIRSHETTLIDVELQRLPSRDVYRIVRD